MMHALNQSAESGRDVHVINLKWAWQLVYKGAAKLKIIKE